MLTRMLLTLALAGSLSAADPVLPPMIGGPLDWNWIDNSYRIFVDAPHGAGLGKNDHQWAIATVVGAPHRRHDGGATKAIDQNSG